MDGGDSGSEIAKEVLTDVEEPDFEKQEKPISAKGASKRKSRTQKESVNNGKQSLTIGDLLIQPIANLNKCVNIDFFE